MTLYLINIFIHVFSRPFKRNHYRFSGTESVALKVADFVVRAFQPVKQSAKQRPSNNYEESVESDKGFPKENEFNVKQSAPLSPWRHLVRLLGLQPNQISAVAVNALIFVAQMVRFKVIILNY